MLKKILVTIGVSLTLGLTACATSFTGSAYVEGGRAGCEAKCKGDGMEVAGIVYMGEYSSACVCSVPGKVAVRGAWMVAAAAGAFTGGADGVAMQRQRQSQQQQQQLH